MHGKALKKLREAGCVRGEDGTLDGAAAIPNPDTPKTPRKRKASTDNDDAHTPKQGRGRPKKENNVKDEPVDSVEDFLIGAQQYLEAKQEEPAN
jgi:hypothetical protein